MMKRGKKNKKGKQKSRNEVSMRYQIWRGRRNSSNIKDISNLKDILSQDSQELKEEQQDLNKSCCHKAPGKVTVEKILLLYAKKKKLARQERRRIFIFKTLRWFGFFAKPLGSLIWSYANSIYHLEDIELDKVYFCKYILCVGYRWQPKFMLNFMNKFMPNFMKERGFFLDININPASVIYSIFCTIFQYQIDRRESNVCPWKWILAKSIFYTLPNSLNFNFNIKIKDIYFAINFSGIIAELLDVIFLSRIRDPKNKSKEENLPEHYDDNAFSKKGIFLLKKDFNGEEEKVKLKKKKKAKKNGGEKGKKKKKIADKKNGIKGFKNNRNNDYNINNENNTMGVLK